MESRLGGRVKRTCYFGWELNAVKFSNCRSFASKAVMEYYYTGNKKAAAAQRIIRVSGVVSVTAAFRSVQPGPAPFRLH
jgi:hypothetical protein